MKRSEINQIIHQADEFIRSQGFHLPPFAYWTPLDWQSKGAEVSEIVQNKLGWDITDFGKADFQHLGLVLFTIRNGNPANLTTQTSKLYAEKIMLVDDGQVTPMHFHWNKMEDIINRGGGQLLLRLFNSTPEEELNTNQAVSVAVDGVRRLVEPGEVVRLVPGESITLEQRCYHTFWGEGRVLVGEVSLVNDDNRDNRFHETLGRFPTIAEDVAPLYLLCTDYERYWPGK